jgi:hypothetical protein
MILDSGFVSRGISFIVNVETVRADEIRSNLESLRTAIGAVDGG